ncbi:MAG: helix-turn-helix transcriptional regulator [Myxococcota bacterium]
MAMNLTKTLATNLRVLRELRGRLGQLELAQRVGVSRRTIARLENAEVADPGVDQVRGLAEALRVPFDLLVTRRLVPITIPVPTDVRDRLEGEEGVALLARIIRAVDEAPKG